MTSVFGGSKEIPAFAGIGGRSLLISKIYHSLKIYRQKMSRSRTSFIIRFRLAIPAKAGISLSPIS
jgi:hypothetical protein